MASDKQIAANRANAQHCKGPTSPGGLARSSQNALKHGLDSKAEVMPCESRAEYETLIAEYYERFHPTVPEERCLVDMLIKSEWHSRRYMSVDAAVWERGFIDTDSKALGLVFIRSQEAFIRVDRRLNSAQRNFQKALKQLTDLRAKRASDSSCEALAEQEPEQTLPAPQTLPSRDREGAVLETSDAATKSLNPKLVSFHQNDFEAAEPPNPALATPPSPVDPTLDPIPSDII